MKCLFICFLLIGNSIFAQVGNENVSFSSGNFFLKGNRPISKEYIVDGSPYVDGDKFYNIQIEGYSKNVQNVRYNAYADEMEFINDGQIYYTNKEEGLKVNFPILKKVYQCLNYSFDNKNRFGYLLLLVDNSKFSLFKREKIELIKGEKSPNAFGKDSNDYYAKEKDLFIIKRNGDFFKLPKNINELINKFSLEKNKIEFFFKDNKLSYSKQDDLIRLFNYINSEF